MVLDDGGVRRVKQVVGDPKEKPSTIPVITEQMEKYINHDLESIVEEHSEIMKIASLNKNANTIDLTTEKSRLIGSKTTYTDNNQEK